MLDKILTTARYLMLGLPLTRLKPDGPLTIPDKFEEMVRSRGSHVFQRFANRDLTYAQTNAHANRVAHWARSVGIEQGESVAFLMLNRPEYVPTWMGLSKVGAVAALLNTNLSHKGLAHAIEAGGARRLIVGAECLEAAETLRGLVPDDLEIYVAPDPDTRSAAIPSGAVDLGPLLASQPEGNPSPELRSTRKTGDDLFFIYTSGTTGLPKAARFSHLKFIATGVASRAGGGFGASDTIYCALPLYHSAGGAMAVSAAMSSGGTIAIRQRFSASAFWDDVERFEATAFQYIGEFCRYLLHQDSKPSEKKHRLKFAVGNGLRPDIWVEFRDRFRIPKIVEFYGATEGNVAAINLDGKVGSVGKMPPRIQVNARLIQYDVEGDTHPRDAEGFCIECEPDEAGELIAEIAGTTGRFEGYTSEEATRKKVLKDVFRKGDQWFRTGDLLRRDAKNYLYFVDRIGDTFRWKGENVSTQEVAEAVSVFPGVELVNVYGVEIPGQDGRAGMAAIVLKDRDAFDGKVFFDFVADALPLYAAPALIRLQDEPEVTGTFKLRKVDLQKEGYDPATVKDPLYVRDVDAKSYVPLNADRHARLLAGTLRV